MKGDGGDGNNCCESRMDYQDELDAKHQHQQQQQWQQQQAHAVSTTRTTTSCHHHHHLETSTSTTTVRSEHCHYPQDDGRCTTCQQEAGRQEAPRSFHEGGETLQASNNNSQQLNYSNQAAAARQQQVGTSHRQLESSGEHSCNHQVVQHPHNHHHQHHHHTSNDYLHLQGNNQNLVRKHQSNKHHHYNNNNHHQPHSQHQNHHHHHSATSHGSSSSRSSKQLATAAKYAVQKLREQQRASAQAIKQLSLLEGTPPSFDSTALTVLRPRVNSTSAARKREVTPSSYPLTSPFPQVRSMSFSAASEAGSAGSVEQIYSHQADGDASACYQLSPCSPGAGAYHVAPRNQTPSMVSSSACSSIGSPPPQPLSLNSAASPSSMQLECLPPSSPVSANSPTCASGCTSLMLHGNNNQHLQVVGHTHYQYFGSGGGSSTYAPSGGSSTISTSDSLSMAINLEQYISKRNERERSRVRNVNDAFDHLKNSLPLEMEKMSKRMSKVEILRTAIGYIRNLEQILGCKQQASEFQQQQQATGRFDARATGGCGAGDYVAASFSHGEATSIMSQDASYAHHQNGGLVPFPTQHNICVPFTPNDYNNNSISCQNGGAIYGGGGGGQYENGSAYQLQDTTGGGNHHYYHYQQQQQ